MNEVIIAAIAAAAGGILAALGKLIVDVVRAKNEPKIKELELGEKFESQIQGLKSSLESSFAEIKESVEDLTDNFNDFRIEQKGYNVVMIRHDIVQVYETYKEKKAIPLPVYQNVLDLFDKYEKLGGNSFVKNIIKEMEQWEKI